MMKITTHAASSRANTFPWPPLLFVAAIIAALLMIWLLPLPWREQHQLID